MRRSPSGPLRAASLAVVACAAVAACSSTSHTAGPAPTALTAKGVSCDHDLASLDAKDVVERVGGLVDDDFVVQFAESTRLGVVALVDGDTEQAFDVLTGTYGVALVAAVDDDAGHLADFEQVRQLVESRCGADGR